MRYDGPLADLLDWLRTVDESRRLKHARLMQLAAEHAVTPHRPYGVPYSDAARKEADRLTGEVSELDACRPMLEQVIDERQSSTPHSAARN